MSNSVKFRPEDLREFASYLKSFNDDLKDKTSDLLGRIAKLGETWEDHKYREFADDLEINTKAYLQQFDRIAEPLISELIKRAEKGEDLLR